MLGFTSEAPLWVITLKMAEAWGIPPWQVESDASAEWIQRWVALHNSEQEKLAREIKRGKSKGKHNRRRGG